MIVPQFDYLLCEEVKSETGAVTQGDVADTWQRYKVLAAGLGRWEYGHFTKVNIQVGDEIYVQKHSEADSPPELKQIGQALIAASRVMAVINGSKS